MERVEVPELHLHLGAGARRRILAGPGVDPEDVAVDRGARDTTVELSAQGIALGPCDRDLALEDLEVLGVGAALHERQVRLRLGQPRLGGRQLELAGRALVARDRARFADRDQPLESPLRVGDGRARLLGARLRLGQGLRLGHALRLPEPRLGGQQARLGTGKLRTERAPVDREERVALLHALALRDHDLLDQSTDRGAQEHELARGLDEPGTAHAVAEGRCCGRHRRRGHRRRLRLLGDGHHRGDDSRDGERREDDEFPVHAWGAWFGNQRTAGLSRVRRRPRPSGLRSPRALRRAWRRA